MPQNSEPRRQILSCCGSPLEAPTLFRVLAHHYSSSTGRVPRAGTGHRRGPRGCGPPSLGCLGSSTIPFLLHKSTSASHYKCYTEDSEAARAKQMRMLSRTSKPSPELPQDEGETHNVEGVVGGGSACCQTPSATRGPPSG